MSCKGGRDESISNLRFICIFLMTFAHNYFAFDLIGFKSHPYYTVPHSPVAYLNFIVFYGFSRVSSPLLGFLSGYFASANLADRSYQRVVYTKLKSLYVPAVFWSIVYFIVIIATAYASGHHRDVRQKIGPLDLEDFLGITKFPLNYPLHYLIDLFKCILLSPVLIYVLRRFGPVTFTILVLFIFIALTGSDLNSYIPGQHAYDIWPRADLAMFFSFGLLAQRCWKLTAGEALMRFRITSPAALLAVALIFLLCTFNWAWLARGNTLALVWAGALALLATRVAGVLLLLALLGRLRQMADNGLRISDRFTFALFCTHVISYFVFNGIVALGHLTAYGVQEFYIVPFFEIGVAIAALCLEIRARTVSHHFFPLLALGNEGR